MSAAPSSLHEALERLAPGTPLRQAIERIIQQRNGALIVLGDGPAVESICSGGFSLAAAPFAPAKLAELAKMDGAIITDDDVRHIMRANVHLLPDPSVATDETGARHRTAERVARQTGKPVVGVSEDRRIATLFLDGEKHELESPATVAANLNQALHTLERFRRRLDDAEEQLTRLELADLVTVRAVITVLQRAELVRRIGQSISQDAVGLGREGDLMFLQMSDLLHGVGTLRKLVLSDYVSPGRRSRVNAAMRGLEAVSTSDLHDVGTVAIALGFEHPDLRASPRGYRLLAQVPRLPDPTRPALVRHFRGFQRMLHAGVDDLAQVEGIGDARAQQLRHFFDRMIDRTQMWRASPDD
jgi:diadenylate cyclase